MKYKILLVLFSVALVFSVLLATAPVETICGEETSSCSVVQDSDYQKTLGINNSILGIFAFLILIGLTIFQMKKPTDSKKNILTAGVLLSCLGAIYFIYLQIFVIGALCPYCMIVDVSTILAFVVLFVKR